MNKESQFNDSRCQKAVKRSGVRAVSVLVNVLVGCRNRTNLREEVVKCMSAAKIVCILLNQEDVSDVDQ